MMIKDRERAVLRDLAQRIAEISALPVMEERRRLWMAHNRLEAARPMILIFPECAWPEVLPGEVLVCESEQARELEWALHSLIVQFEQLRDDTVIEAEWVVDKVIRQSDWGLVPRRIHSDDQRGAWGFDPVIQTPADLKKLRSPTIEYDEAATQALVDQAQDLLGDILTVRPRGVAHVSFHLMAIYTSLRGLEQVMMDMIECPDMLHEAMSILEAGHQHLVRQYVDQNLLERNNNGTYHSSGGVGYTTELPGPEYDPNRVLPHNMWCSAESQEMAQVSPEMHFEFAMQYEQRLMAPFGLNGYGCCDDLTRKLDHVLAMPNMRRVSISPFADVDRCAEIMARRAIFSWKPNPAMLVGDFCPDRVRAYIRHTLDVAGDCVLEMILKDTHTCQHQPERFSIWSDIAREEVEALVG